ncbi:hypothetical protein THASP1DRAFT_26320 [Thamnocephalis sphaerospora]|uniref:WW domain-containing protein n=1 Tax=Thamnocephalis sphaerospora TaxID=78915 RepID=A0A4P9XHH3_9FUNG|nr:hypothetical protein THASP1DRAFT_26320 [Thamnocephalis sphaerospora]|eukprot:RKP05133.1 hypothetical protein THASP1DRAFT_26320 [Thamnocephalis sphaerospora]
MANGWVISQYDQASGRYFYVDTATGASSWDDPRPAYYASQSSGASTPAPNMPSNISSPGGPGYPPVSMPGGPSGGPGYPPMSMPGDSSGSGGYPTTPIPSGGAPGSSDKTGLPPAGAPLNGPPSLPGYSAAPGYGGPPGQPGYGAAPGYGGPPGQPGYGAAPGYGGPPGQPGYGAAPGYGAQPPPQNASYNSPDAGSSSKIGLGGAAAMAGGAGLLGMMAGKLSGGHGNSGMLGNMMQGGNPMKPNKPPKPGKTGGMGMAGGAAAVLGGGALGYMAGHMVGGHGKKHKKKGKGWGGKGWKGWKGKGWKGKGWKGFGKGWKYVHKQPAVGYRLLPSACLKCNRRGALDASLTRYYGLTQRCSAPSIIVFVKEANAPIAGEVLENSSEPINNPEMINSDAETDGWLAKVRPTNASNVNKFMDKNAYGKFVQQHYAAANAKEWSIIKVLYAVTSTVQYADQDKVP